MRSGDLAPFGLDGGAVKVDETYIGRKAVTDKPKGGWGHKLTVLGLIDRRADADALTQIRDSDQQLSFKFMESHKDS